MFLSVSSFHVQHELDICREAEAWSCQWDGRVGSAAGFHSVWQQWEVSWRRNLFVFVLLCCVLLVLFCFVVFLAPKQFPVGVQDSILNMPALFRLIAMPALSGSPCLFFHVSPGSDVRPFRIPALSRFLTSVSQLKSWCSPCPDLCALNSWHLSSSCSGCSAGSWCSPFSDLCLLNSLHVSPSWGRDVCPAWISALNSSHLSSRVFQLGSCLNSSGYFLQFCASSCLYSGVFSGFVVCVCCAVDFNDCVWCRWLTA